jgi:effector-binding domain-containing protein
VGVAHDVVTTTVAARPTAVVRAATTWPAFPGLWKTLLDEVWSCLRAQGITSGHPNVMLYQDNVPHVEVGVLSPPALLTGAVVASALPAGPVATTVHRGSYAGLGDAHDDVIAWCAEQGLRRAGPRWEIYGPNRPDAEVEIYHLLSPSGDGA